MFYAQQPMPQIRRSNIPVATTIAIGFALLSTCMLALASSPTAAQGKPADQPQPADATEDFHHGLYWSIAKDGQVVGHLFGTFHSNDPRVLALLTERLRQQIKSSYSFSMEAFPGSRYFNPHYGFRNIIEDMTLPEGESLSALIGADTYKKLEQVLLSIGGQRDRIKRLKPWAAMNELGKLSNSDKASKEQQGPIMDHVLYEEAVDNVVDLYQLETLEELMAAYYDFPMDAQIALLKDRLQFYEQLPQTAESMLAAYLNEDLEQMMSLSKAFISPASMQKGYEKVYLKHVLHIRNIVMAHYMLLPLRRKNAFIAVGALHLYGQHGLLNILRDTYGFSVQRLSLHKPSAASGSKP